MVLEPLLECPKGDCCHWVQKWNRDTPVDVTWECTNCGRQMKQVCTHVRDMNSPTGESILVIGFTIVKEPVQHEGLLDSDDDKKREKRDTSSFVPHGGGKEIDY
jgi:hypothetical protein